MVSKIISVHRIKVNMAFTLAEVLITLGIIGIVAAMTIPTLIANYQKKQTVSKLQKAYSTLSNMTMMMHADNAYSALSGTVSAEKTEKFFYEYVLKYFRSPMISSNSVCPYSECDAYKNFNNTSVGMSIRTSYEYGRVFFTTNDGISYFFSNMKWIVENDEDGNSIQHAEYTASPTVMVDLNGIELPNTLGKDVFQFITDFANGVTKTGCEQNTDAYVNENCSSSGIGTCCVERIRRAGWKITYDY